ncbi:MAG: hypothetical protein ACLPX5_14530 [Dissulfurispiraceae bacterium]
MAYDEFEISLLREIAVCNNRIKKIKKVLNDMEDTHNIKTPVFVEKFGSRKTGAHNGDFIDWMNNYEALLRWESMKRQYQEMLNQVKI